MDFVVSLMQMLSAVSPAACLLVAIRTETLSGIGLCLVLCLIVFFGFRVYGLLAECTVAIRSTSEAVSAIVELHPDYYLKEYGLNKYIDAKTHAWPFTNVRLIVAQPRNTTTLPLAALKAYVNRTGITLIVLADPPETQSTVQQFFLYHEIGHASTWGALHVLNLQYTWMRLALSYAPCLLLVDNVWARLAVVFAYFAHLLVEHFEHLPELSADYFAVWKLHALVVVASCFAVASFLFIQRRYCGGAK